MPKCNNKFSHRVCLRNKVGPEFIKDETSAVKCTFQVKCLLETSKSEEDYSSFLCQHRPCDLPFMIS